MHDYYLTEQEHIGKFNIKSTNMRASHIQLIIKPKFTNHIMSKNT